MGQHYWNLIMIAVVALVIFIIAREFWCWYWKINEIISVLKSIDKKLGDNVGRFSPQEIRSHPRGNEGRSDVKEKPILTESEKIGQFEPTMAFKRGAKSPTGPDDGEFAHKSTKKMTICSNCIHHSPKAFGGTCRKHQQDTKPKFSCVDFENWERHRE